MCFYGIAPFERTAALSYAGFFLVYAVTEHTAQASSPSRPQPRQLQHRAIPSPSEERSELASSHSPSLHIKRAVSLPSIYDADRRHFHDSNGVASAPAYAAGAGKRSRQLLQRDIRAGDSSKTWGQKAVRVCFYVWLSVINLIGASVLWARMADVFNSQAGLRLFGFLGAGATCGASLLHFLYSHSASWWLDLDCVMLHANAFASALEHLLACPCIASQKPCFLRQSMPPSGQIDSCCRAAGGLCYCLSMGQVAIWHLRACHVALYPDPALCPHAGGSWQADSLSKSSCQLFDSAAKSRRCPGKHAAMLWQFHPSCIVSGAHEEYFAISALHRYGSGTTTRCMSMLIAQCH